jgi:glycosyltransferase involved in cell wall biosynthesis
MKASVIITTWCRKESLCAIIDALLVQNYPLSGYEIIVCDSKSPDGTSELIDQFRQNYPDLNIRIVHAFNSISHKRNLGISCAQGEFLIFIDDDCVPQENFLRYHVEFASTLPKKSLVSGLIRYKDLSLFKSKSYIRYKISRHNLTNARAGKNLNRLASIVAMNLCVRRDEILKDNISFNELICAYGLEDYDFAKECYASGYVSYVGYASVFHNEISANFLSFSHKVIELARVAMPLLMASKNFPLYDLPFYLIERNRYVLALARWIPESMIAILTVLIARLYDRLPFVSNSMARALIISSYITGITQRSQVRQ